MARFKATVLGAVSSQVVMLTSMLLSIVLTPLYLKYLTNAEYGLNILLIQVGTYISLLDFGMGSAITRELAVKNSEDGLNEIVSTGFYFFALIGILVIAAGFLVLPALPWIFKIEPSLKNISEYVFLSSVVLIAIQFPLKVFQGMLFAHQRQFLSNIISFFSGIVSGPLVILFLYLDFGLWSFVITNIITSILNILFVIISLKKYYKKLQLRISFFRPVLLKGMFSYGFYIFLTSIAGMIVYQTDRVVVGSIISVAAVTGFSITLRVPELGFRLVNQISRNAFPSLIHLLKEGDLVKVRHIFYRIMMIMVTLSSAMFWLVIILNKRFITVWVGSDYYMGQEVIIPFSIFMLLFTILNVNGIYLNGIGIARQISIIAIAEATINLILSIVLGKKMGVSGVVCASLIASLATSAWFISQMTMKHLGISLTDFLKPILKPVLITSLPGVILYLTTEAILPSNLNWMAFLGLSLIVGSLFLVLTWFVLKREIEEYFSPRIRKSLSNFGL